MHLLDNSSQVLAEWLSNRGLPAYRAGQVRRWVFQGRAADFEQMTDLPKDLRQALAAELQIWSTTVAAHHTAADGTEKLLLQLHDGQRIECVLLRQGPLRRTICISTQVGCGMGCVFCASGLDGVVRNLTAGEIVEQMLQLQRLLPPAERLSHIVVMGMGEPLANLENLLPALDDATSSTGLGLSARRITISTVGLPAAIRKLAARDLQYHLAVSLHAPDDALRTRLVPVNKNIGLSEILQAAREYFETTGRRLTFEYVLLGGINDNPDHARRLAALLRDQEALVNVIPYNPVAGLPYQTPTLAATQRFQEILERSGVRVHLRRRKGDTISAACGQLRRSVRG
jgi:23S rRNA (adenine2503-C2)-methyltransferase